MANAICNAKILDPNSQTAASWLENCVLIFENGRIVDIVEEKKAPLASMSLIDANGTYLVPGFFDTQVNGGGGVLLNDAPTVEGLRAIFGAHANFGTAAMLPTLITDELSVVARAIQAVDAAIEQGVPGIVGIHLEGPFLNPARKGVHDAEKFKRIDATAVELLSSLKNGKTLVTLAPEKTSPPFIQQLVEAGVVVAAGHTGGTYSEIREALDVGLSSFTHLYNAMSPLSSREPGCVGAALECSQSWCGIIVDGFHVHDAALKVAIQAKPKGKVVLVTDAMPSVGAKDKSFTLNGERISAVDGRCATAQGTLAGSDLDMLSAVKNTYKNLDVELAEVVRMASLYPAQMMGLDKDIGSLAKGRRASFMLLDNKLDIARMWVEGIELSRM